MYHAQLSTELEIGVTVEPNGVNFTLHLVHLNLVRFDFIIYFILILHFI
jgi:hypothetical protein